MSMKGIQQLLAAAGAVPPLADAGRAEQFAELERLKARHAELLREVKEAREEGTFWGHTHHTELAMQAFNHASRVEAEAAAVAVRIAAIERHLGEGRLS